MRPSDLIEKVLTASYLQILFQKVCSKLRLFDSILFLIKENLLQQNVEWKGFGALGIVTGRCPVDYLASN